ncbi:MAG: hypothetical protein HUU47_11205, partial [Bacteroidetes bacterium]|nr:hypothetical protein [Bacteroidota bacterium]
MFDFLRGNPIKNGDSLVPLYHSFFVQRNDSLIDLIGDYDTIGIGVNVWKSLYKSGGYEYDKIQFYTPGLYSHSVLLSSNPMKAIDKNKLLQPYPINLVNIDNIHRVKDYQYRFLSSYYKAPYNYGKDEDNILQINNYADGVFYLTDSIKIDNSAQLFKEPIPILPNERIYDGKNVGEGKLTFGQDKLFYIKKASICKKISFYLEPVIEYTGICMVDIDAATGKVIGNERVLKEGQQRTQRHLNWLPKGSYYSYSDFEISPNDSILYYIEKEYILDSSNNQRIDNFIYRVFSWRFRDGGAFNPIPIFISDKYKDYFDGITSININPYGKLNIIIRNNTPGNYREAMMMNLNETNRPKGLSSTFSTISLPSTTTVNLKPQLYLYDFIRISSKIDYNCEAQVSTKNQSDLSGGMNDFTWYFTKENGIIDTVWGFEPKVVYKKNGKYPFKVHGVSNIQNGYSEWYHDTIYINIPAKPIAAFKAADTVICRYLPLQFTNLCHAKEIKP